MAELKSAMHKKFEKAKTKIGFYVPEDHRDEEASEKVYRALRPRSQMAFVDVLQGQNHRGARRAGGWQTNDLKQMGMTSNRSSSTLNFAGTTDPASKPKTQTKVERAR